MCEREREGERESERKMESKGRICENCVVALGLYCAGSGRLVQRELSFSWKSMASGMNLRSNLVADNSYSFPSHSVYTLEILVFSYFVGI